MTERLFKKKASDVVIEVFIIDVMLRNKSLKIFWIDSAPVNSSPFKIGGEGGFGFASISRESLELFWKVIGPSIDDYWLYVSVAKKRVKKRSQYSEMYLNL